MTLPQLQLSEPLVSAIVSLLEANLNTVIDELNATLTDSYAVEHVVQFKPYVPVPSTLAGGCPAVGVQRLGAQFADDLQYSADAVHEYAVVAIVQNSDQESLVWQLDRTIQAIANVIQADRAAGTTSGTGGVMRDDGGAWSVNFQRTEPGPVLGDLDPTSDASPPRIFLSWSALILSSKRREI